MTRALLLLVLVGCGGGAKTLRLPAFAPARGSSELFDRTVTEKDEVHQETETLTSTTVIHRRWHQKVVELEGTLATRVEVRFEVDETIHTGTGSEETIRGPLMEKSYVMWRENDALEAEHADGAPITAEERGALNAAFRHLGTTSQIRALITGRAWKRDELVPLDRDVIAEHDLAPDPDVREATITWSGGDSFRALFTYTFDGWEFQRTVDERFDRASGRATGLESSTIGHTKIAGYDVVSTVHETQTMEVE